MSDSIQQLLKQLRAGNIRALAKAISLVEAGSLFAHDLLAASFPFTGQSLRIGVTGSPGAGKSTLVDRLAQQFRAAGKTVGVIAVDPTSPFTGGALLGDRIRMQGFSADPGFYARSMATRGALGGVARTTADVISMVEASGKDVVLVETVGVGQDEVDIARLADITLVVLVPGMGDDVQSIKAGILEIADIFVINKSDREGADRLESEIASMQSLGHGRELDWQVPIIRTTASTGSGIEGVARAISNFEEWLAIGRHLEDRRTMQWRERILEMVQGELLREFRAHRLSEAELDFHARAVMKGEENPYLAVPRLTSEKTDLRKVTNGDD